MVALKLTGPALLFAGFGLILWGIFELSECCLCWVALFLRSGFY